MSKVISYVLAVAIVVALIGLASMLIWNIGIVGLVAACGGHVSSIGFWTALFADLALVAVQRGWQIQHTGLPS